VQAGPNDVPSPCPRCQQMTLHRPGPDGQLHCLACMMRPATPAPPVQQHYASMHPQVQQPRQQHPVQIEQTAKRYKAWMLVGGLTFLVGLCVIASNAGAGVAITLIGGLVYLAAKMAA